MFITFEGPEGAGKTSVLEVVAKRLKKDGIDCLVTREPGGIPISEAIRNVLLDQRYTNMDGVTEALLYAAARRQHLIEKIEPALREGKLVLCDRFIDSSLAYQGVARNIGFDVVYEMNALAIGQMMPDHTLFFDLLPEEGLARIYSNEEREKNRLDQEALSFHESVYEGYQEVLRRFPERIDVIDASAPLEEVIESVYAQIKAYYNS